MLLNYLKSALRNFLRYKAFALVNILSLAIGMTGCLIIGLFVIDELKFDKHIKDHERIYRIYEEHKESNGTTYNAPVPPMYATFLKEQYPETEVAARILMLNDEFLLETGKFRNYENKGMYVDEHFLQVFPLEMFEGNNSTALEEPNSVVISRIMADQYFGKGNPVGKILTIDKSNYQVTGVFKSLPDHFHLDFRYLMSLSSLQFPEARMKIWTWHQFYTYVKFKPGTDYKLVETKFRDYIKKEILPLDKNADSKFMPFLQPLIDIHLKSATFVYDNSIRGNETYVKALSLLAFFVLVIACFNFVNLATARSFKRAREIGIRKVIGAHKKQLVSQFIGETVLLSVIALFIAMISAIYLLGPLNEFTGKSIVFNPFVNPLIFFALLSGGVLTGIIAGLYPAFILSSFRPIKDLKSMKGSDRTLSTAGFRKSLVVLQFVLSVLLIISTAIVYRQTVYFSKKDLGFNKEQVLTFQVRGELEQKLEAFKAELRQINGVTSVTSGYGLPGDRYAGDEVIIPGENGDVIHATTLFIGDHDYIKTLGLRLIEGRDFSREMATDEREAFIINETAVREFGFGTPSSAIGKPIKWREWNPVDSLHPIKKGKVIGVIEDFHYKSLHEKVSSSVIQLYPAVLYKIAVKLKPSETAATVTSIKHLWDQFSPVYPFDYDFIDDSYALMYNSEEKMGTLLWLFTIMAIMVGCMGLFALAALSAEERTKEIGIRKVLGAGIIQIMNLLSKSFMKLIVIASLIAMPLAWLAMNRWLEEFPYRVSIEWWIFVATFLLTAFIALVTISLQIIKVALMKPVKALRTE
ncbi:MAG: ABC transporter permease [Chloroflexota bacterium]